VEYNDDVTYLDSHNLWSEIFQVLMAVYANIMVFKDVAHCSLVPIYLRSSESSVNLYQARRYHVLKTNLEICKVFKLSASSLVYLF